MRADEATELFDWAAALTSAEGVKTTEAFIARQLKALTPAQRAWALAENLKFPRQHAARLVVDHCTQDWRDVVPLIDLPALVVGSWANRQSQAWIGAHMPQARVEIFEESEGGSHFMFLENPGKFNQLVREFIG
jgi:non-heme chloroperoxidase